MPGAKRTVEGTAVSAFVSPVCSELSTGDNRADEATSDSSVSWGGAMVSDAGRRLIGLGVKFERDVTDCRGSAAAQGFEGGGFGGGRTASES